MAASEDDGLGLEHGIVRLERSRVEWASLARDLAGEAARGLGADAIRVEHIGSTAVPGLLAKPIVDIAVGVGRGADHEAVCRRLETLGWIYRGDAGEEGGHVFILERGSGIRIAHLHVVEHEGAQWRRYLALRDRLQKDPAARAAYEQAKLALIEEHGTDNSKRAYTSGKTAILRELLGEFDRSHG